MWQIFSLFPEKPESVQPAEGQVLCKVCGDIANGIHFGVNTCEGCKVQFFCQNTNRGSSFCVISILVTPKWSVLLQTMKTHKLMLHFIRV